MGGGGREAVEAEVRWSGESSGKSVWLVLITGGGEGQQLRQLQLWRAGSAGRRRSGARGSLFRQSLAKILRARTKLEGEGTARPPAPPSLAVVPTVFPALESVHSI